MINDDELLIKMNEIITRHDLGFQFLLYTDKNSTVSELLEALSERLSAITTCPACECEIE